jgi:hypothetical protein
MKNLYFKVTSGKEYRKNIEWTPHNKYACYCLDNDNYIWDVTEGNKKTSFRGLISSSMEDFLYNLCNDMNFCLLNLQYTGPYHFWIRLFIQNILRGVKIEMIIKETEE